jgi:hypothetical protein
VTEINLIGSVAARALALKLRRRYPDEFEKSLRQTLRAIGRRTVGKLKQASPKGASGKLRQAHGSLVSRLGLELVVFNRLQRSLFLAGGTGPAADPPRPGKFPWDSTREGKDQNPLRDWVLKKGIAADIRRRVNATRKRKKITLKQAQDIGAFLVGRAIKRKGVQPNDWFERTIRSATPQMRIDMRNAMRVFARRAREAT